MASNSDIDKRIALEQAKIDVPSYQDAAWDGGWKRRAGAIWGVGAVAGITGAVMGLTTPLAPMLFAGMAPSAAMAMIPTSVAVFSALGITAGMAIGGVMGPNAGAAASAMKEYERRQIARDVEEKIRENPEAEVQLIARDPIPREAEKTDFKFSNYVNLKTGLLFAAIGAAGGLVFAAALAMTGGIGSGLAGQFIMPAAKVLLGAAAENSAIVTAYSMGLGAAFGANFGVSFSLITRKAVNFANDLLSGKLLGDPWPRKTNIPEMQPVLSPVVVKHPELEEAVAPEQPKFAEKVQRAPNYEKLVAQSIKEAENCCHSRT